MPDDDNKPTTEETLKGIKYILIEGMEAFNSLQGVIYDQTEQLEILTGKIMHLECKLRHWKKRKDAEEYRGGLPIFERPLFQAFMIIFSGMGVYYFADMLSVSIVKMALSWG